MRDPFVTTTLDRYRASLSHVKPLTPEQELELARRWREGDEKAGRRLVESSLPFVIRVAREYRRWGVPLEDLVQQGNLGLLRAALKFDPDKACRLITYAAYWIRAEIRDYVVRTYRIVRLGTTRTERRAMRAFRRKGVEDVAELAELSGMPLARAEKLWPLLTQGDVWLDASYEDRSSAMERLPDDMGWTPEDEVARSELVDNVRGALDDALSALSERERRIVQARMMSEDPCTLEQLGREMGVSKERVRQLEARAKQKLQESLADFRPVAA
ncbi:MAG: sigma-70 family RNA polymerase sigma factor [Sandaracinus sp.]|nr:sigma-70 family RNA polymerase sigma factor [Myxococcales bacterium]MCB9611564.1 sigma-70 family RNA polymerase sigma factor [Sandaracinus sp.]MCB9618778.1 sigma-70 family RNA polymerase sigma factor [Sandaracinus sp.]